MMSASAVRFYADRPEELQFFIPDALPGQNFCKRGLSKKQIGRAVHIQSLSAGSPVSASTALPLTLYFRLYPESTVSITVRNCTLLCPENPENFGNPQGLQLFILIQTLTADSHVFQGLSGICPGKNSVHSVGSKKQLPQFFLFCTRSLRFFIPENPAFPMPAEWAGFFSSIPAEPSGRA